MYHVSSSTKVYIRFKDNLPDTLLTGAAYDGFSKLGAELVPFYWSDEIDKINDLGPETLICGYINDVHCGLLKLNKQIPLPVDYPESLKDFLGRDIFETTLGEIRSNIHNSSQEVFIKPLQQKAFTGFVYDGGPLARRRILLHEDNIKVFKCQPLNMLSEYRCTILDGTILDVRRYKGDWSLVPQRSVIEDAVNIFEASGEAPVSYTLDFGVIKTEKKTGTYYQTILIEMNDGYAFGHYGMESTAYASCLAARWKEMVQ